jgi:hypothetical protein
MVEKGECFITRFGSIHKSEMYAKEMEVKEERLCFSKKMCAQLKTGNWGSPHETAAWVYDHRALVKHMLETFDFIEPVPEYCPVKDESGCEEGDM